MTRTRSFPPCMTARKSSASRACVVIAAALTLAGCEQGGFSGQFGNTDTTTTPYGAVTATPTAAGSFAGVADADTTVVRDANGNGYAFAYANVDAATYGDTTVASGTRGQYAIAGVLPNTALGTMPTTGSALMTGTYNLVVVSGASTSNDPANWTVTRPTGTVSATIDFSTGKLAGTSGDGNLTISNPAGTKFTNGFAGDVSYLGTAGSFAGVLGPNDAVAAMTGQDSSRFYAGGFAIGR